MDGRWTRKGGQSKTHLLLTVLEEAIEEKLQDLKFSKTGSAANTNIRKMHTRIHFAVETVRYYPRRRERTGSTEKYPRKQNISWETYSQLWMGVSKSLSAFKQKSRPAVWRIFNSLERRNGQSMSEANVWQMRAMSTKSTNELCAEKREKPPYNLATDTAGNTLGCATESMVKIPKQKVCSNR